MSKAKRIPKQKKVAALKPARGRRIVANDERGVWEVHEDGAWLAEFESESVAQEFAAAPELHAFAALIARMKTEEEFGDDAPPSEDWISTLNDLIAQARELEKKVRG